MEKPVTTVQLLVLSFLAFMKEEGCWRGDTRVDWSLAERGAQYIAQSVEIPLAKYPYEKPLGDHVYRAPYQGEPLPLVKPLSPPEGVNRYAE